MGFRGEDVVRLGQLAIPRASKPLTLAAVEKKIPVYLSTYIHAYLNFPRKERAELPCHIDKKANTRIGYSYHLLDRAA